MDRTLTERWQLNYLNETELITRAQNGDTEAFTPIVHRYRERIYRLIYKWVRHHETAEDLCQEVFLKAWRGLPKFKGGSVFYGWLHQIAVNCSIDFLRKQKRQIIYACEELPDNADDVLQMTEIQSGPDKILETKELRDIISECVRQLPSCQRRVFYLHYHDGLRIKEIASRLNKSENTIKAHLYNARQKLQHRLRPYVRNGFLGVSKEI